MFNMISVFYSAEIHLLFRVSWNSGIKAFDIVNIASEITRYSVPKSCDWWERGKVGQWTEIKKIKDVSVRELKIALERGKVYQFAITATNKLSESLKQEKENIQQVKAEGSNFKWISFSPLKGLSFSFLRFNALSVSSISRYLRVNSSLAKTLINVKNFT